MLRNITFIAILCPLLAASPASADDWKDESGHGREWKDWNGGDRGETPGWERGKGYWDGHSKRGYQGAPPFVQAPPPQPGFYSPPPPYYYGRHGGYYYEGSPYFYGDRPTWGYGAPFPSREAHIGARIGGRIGEAIGGPEGAAIGADIGAGIGADIAAERHDGWR